MGHGDESTATAAPRTRNRVAVEVAASVLAATTAFIGGNAANLPVWGIFVGWAGTFALGGPSRDVAKRLWLTMPIGSTGALVIVASSSYLGPFFSAATAVQDVVLAICIFVFNGLMMSLGRVKLLSTVPGMFFGFSSYFATYFGGFGFAPHNLWAAWVSVVAMNALGPVFAYLNARLTFPRRVGSAAQAETVTAAEPS
jgi:uncharacterized protein DUF1097